MSSPPDGSPSRPLRIDILSIFPEMFEPVLGASICGRARSAGLVEWFTTNIRDFAKNKHSKVDERPFGGGPGMVMMCQPIWDAISAVESADDRKATRIYMTPQGRPLTQPLVRDLAGRERLLILAGHYEGVDERVIERLDPIEISMGDFVLSGGEIPAMALIDAVVRLQSGALGHADSAGEDSFEPHGADAIPLLDCPHYTRPRVWEGMETPNILLSGDHPKIAQWRLAQSFARTQSRRPDMLADIHKDEP